MIVSAATILTPCIVLIGIFVSSLSVVAQSSVYFSFRPENKEYLQYYFFANVFDSSSVIFRFGEAALTAKGKTNRIYLANTVDLDEEVQASGIQGENVDLRTVARTGDFTLEGGGILSWFGKLMAFRNPCDGDYPDSGGHNKPTQAWALLDQTEFVTELMRVSDNTRIAVLDSVGVMPPSLGGTPVDTRYGANPEQVNKYYIIPSVLDGVKAYIRISPRRYGPTPLGMKLWKLSNWVNHSALYDSTGMEFIPAAAYEALGKAYYQEFFTYCDSVKSATGWLPDISNVGLNDSLANILNTRYFENRLDSANGKVTYKIERNTSMQKRGGATTMQVLSSETVTSRNTRIVTQHPELLSTSPNPGKSGQITVKIRAYTALNVVIRLISIDGKTLGTLWTGTLTKGIEDYTLDTSSLTPGAYFLSLEGNDGSRFHNIKIVVQ